MCSSRDVGKSASIPGITMDEENVPALKHTHIITLHPSKPLGSYYSFNAVTDFAKGRRKSVN